MRKMVLAVVASGAMTVGPLALSAPAFAAPASNATTTTMSIPATGMTMVCPSGVTYTATGGTWSLVRTISTLSNGSTKESATAVVKNVTATSSTAGDTTVYSIEGGIVGQATITTAQVASGFQDSLFTVTKPSHHFFSLVNYGYDFQQETNNVTTTTAGGCTTPLP